MHLELCALCVQIVAAVSPRRDSLDACMVFPSMPAVMRLNKLGSFSMAQLGQSKSPFAEFMRSARKNSDNFEENLLKLVRTLPAVLKYLPSQKAQDARIFVQVCHAGTLGVDLAFGALGTCLAGFNATLTALLSDALADKCCRPANCRFHSSMSVDL